MDAATASEAEDVVVAQDGSPAVRPVPVHVSPVAMAGAVPQQRQGWRQQESEEGEDTKKMRAMWFKDMRGWLMVLAMQIASSTYQAGLNPPRGFSGDTSHSTPILESTSHSRSAPNHCRPRLLELMRPASPVHPIPSPMSSEDTLDAATASESKDKAPPPATATSEAQDAPPADSASKLVRVSLVAAAGAVQVQPRAYSSQGCRQESDEGDDPIGRRATEIRARWFKDMRGWIMVLAMQVASSTYQAGLNPPGGFSGDGTPMLKSTSQNRYYYYMFFYFNTTAFVTSLAIILLLMNPSFYHSEAKVLALETIVVLDVVGLMGAYWAGTASATRDQVTKYTLALTAVVLFVVYVVYMVQLLHKLWRLATAIALRHAPPMRARAANAAPPGT